MDKQPPLETQQETPHEQQTDLFADYETMFEQDAARRLVPLPEVEEAQPSSSLEHPALIAHEERELTDAITHKNLPLTAALELR